MIECRIKGNVYLPYGHSITKMLEHMDFNLEEEEWMENSIKIGDNV